MNKKILYLIFGFLLTQISIFAQTNIISGQLLDDNSEPIAFATIGESGSSNGTSTDAQGYFTIKLLKPGSKIVISCMGYQKAEFSSPYTNIFLVKKTTQLGNVTVVGTRNSNRSVINSVAPVDIIDIRDVTNKQGQIDINQMLQFAAPSFNSNRQSGSDGADHVDPASLRGLGPDQTLVLVNGKRYHQSSLVNLYGSRGRGNTGTDLNTIPASAVEKIEILRDGAAAQYGSDAIAGVINIILKKNTDNLQVNASYGAYNAQYRPDDKKLDGQNFQLSANYGLKLNQKGYLNMNLDYNNREHTNRAYVPKNTDLARREFGDPKANNISFYFNGNYPLSDKSELYLFGGFNSRSGEAYAWTRSKESGRNDTTIYPNGFDPIITSNILDRTTTLGYKTKLASWNFDASFTSGANSFGYGVKNTLNRSMGSSTPTSFEAGGFGLSQNVINATISKNSEFMEGFNLAFGTEYRQEKYNINAGEEASYKQYDINYAGGSQGFPGFQPSDEINKGRSNLGLFADFELDLSKDFTVVGAARFENYSDFGQSLIYRLGLRHAFSKALTMRMNYNTGFRAPSLAQKYFNQTITNFVGGVPQETLIARNEGDVANALGVPALKQEKSKNMSLGFTYNPSPKFTLTVDGYNIEIKDRIVLTGQFTTSDSTVASYLSGFNVYACQMFTNAVSTETQGIDIIASHNEKLDNKTRLTTTLALNFNKMDTTSVYTNSKLSDFRSNYFDIREYYFLLASAPPFKGSLSFNVQRSTWSANLRFTKFGKVALADWNYDINKLNVYDSRTTTDLSFTYKLNKGVQFTLGSSNLFNVYPKIFDPMLTESGGNWDPVQMGNNGRFVFVKLKWDLIKY